MALKQNTFTFSFKKLSRGLKGASGYSTQYIKIQGKFLEQHLEELNKIKGKIKDFE